MLSEQLLSELHNLNRTEKLHVVQILVNELALEELMPETSSEAARQYEIWSPYDAFEAANTLQTMLDEYKREHGQS
jgi:hypothetical protein